MIFCSRYRDALVEQGKREVGKLRFFVLSLLCIQTVAALLQNPLLLYAQANPSCEQSEEYITAENSESISKRLEELFQRAYELRWSSPEQAAEIFKEIVRLDPQNVQGYRELGYVLIELGEKQEALSAFEQAEALAPEHEPTKLQIGYLLDSLGRKHEAYRKFDALRSSANPEIREKAEVATINLVNWRWHDDSSPYFSEFEWDSFAGSRRDLTVAFLRAAYGARLDAQNLSDIYFGFRYYTQAGQDEHLVPEPFSDTSLVGSVGIRTRPFREKNIMLYSELGTTLLESARERKKGDFRLGVSYFQSWQPEARAPAKTTYPLDRVADLYAEATYFSRFDDNVILYARQREGRRLMESSQLTLDAYLVLSLYLDTNKAFYNNLGEMGLGLRYVPDRRVNLTLYAEHSRGFYFRGERPEHIGANYSDFRLGVSGLVMY